MALIQDSLRRLACPIILVGMCAVFPVVDSFSAPNSQSQDITGTTFFINSQNQAPSSPKKQAKLSKEEAQLEEQILKLATSSEVDYEELEKQILASAKAQVDYNQVVNALSVVDKKDGAITKPMSSSDNFFGSFGGPSSSTWQVSLAASVAFSLTVHFLFAADWFVTAMVFVFIFCVAYADPVDDDNLLGAVARMVGRETLQSYQTTVEPKARAMARAVLTTEEEIAELRSQLKALERENEQLARWKYVRIQAEEHLSDYTLNELKIMAREEELPVGGTKLQLMVRLLENNVLAIPEQKQG